jgi:hypothetical protein
MNREYLILLYEVTLDRLKGQPHDGIAFINGKLFRHQKDGSCIVIPSDGSYVRIITKTWYE